MNLVRSERRQAALGARLQHELVAARQGAVPDGLEASDILAAFATLSDRDKEILLLAGWYGLSPAEVAARLGCSSGAAATRLTRARGRLLAASEGR
jgi:RNA polymerase sigma-70 factor (ECF subfamily)